MENFIKKFNFGFIKITDIENNKSFNLNIEKDTKYSTDNDLINDLFIEAEKQLIVNEPYQIIKVKNKKYKIHIIIIS